jgi:energy-coupling factor transporter transmembrane protein EcfT
MSLISLGIFDVILIIIAILTIVIAKLLFNFNVFKIEKKFLLIGFIFLVVLIFFSLWHTDSLYDILNSLNGAVGELVYDGCSGVFFVN